jgi:hypothetical protein
MPLLPHLIDLGKELAHFSTTVVRVVPPPPAHRFGVDEEDDDMLRHDGKDVNGSHVERNNGGRSLGGSADDDEEDEVGREEDILRVMWRACWDVIETIQERVQLSVEMEEEERRRAVNGGGGPGAIPPPYSMSKISREGYREGEETYVVYEQYEGHELESFDGFNRGYDSDDESFGQQSGHDLM